MFQIEKKQKYNNISKARIESNDHERNWPKNKTLLKLDFEVKTLKFKALRVCLTPLKGKGIPECLNLDEDRKNTRTTRQKSQ